MSHCHVNHHTCSTNLLPRMLPQIWPYVGSLAMCTSHESCQCNCSLVPRPHPKSWERDMVSLAKIPVCAKLAYYATHPYNHIPYVIDSLCSSHALRNVIIGNGRTWFLYSKWRLLTQHIRESLQVTPAPFPDFWLGLGDEASVNVLQARWSMPVYNAALTHMYTNEDITVWFSNNWWQGLLTTEYLLVNNHQSLSASNLAKFQSLLLLHLRCIYSKKVTKTLMYPLTTYKHCMRVAYDVIECLT